MAKAGSGEMKGVFIGCRCLIMALAAELVIGRWFFYHPDVGLGLFRGLIIPFVTESAPFD